MSNSGTQQPPAWSGKSKQSNPGATLPPEFAQVSGLGPVKHVSHHQGLRLLPSFGPPRVSLLVRYGEGMAYHTGDQEVHTLPWREVAAITSNISGHDHGSSAAFTVRYYNHEYTLTKTNGDQIVLDDGLKDVGDEAWAIKKSVFRLLRPPALERYQSGEALTFGPVTVHKQNGLQLEGQTYAWNGIQNVKLTDGRLKVMLSSGQHHEAHVPAIPNVEVLCDVIGVTFEPEDLSHLAFI